MISLNGNGQKLCKNRQGHTWRALEEILACSVALDSSVIDKRNILLKVYSEAKLSSIPQNSVHAKIGNYTNILNGGSFNHSNEYTNEVYSNYSSFKAIYDDVFYNKWRKYDVNRGAPVLFDGHSVQLLFSSDYLSSIYSQKLNLDITFFNSKINSYINNIFKYVTPQRFVEHTNAIKLLDKIIIVSKDEAQILENNMRPQEHDEIPEYMGLFCASNRDNKVYFDENGNHVAINNKECVIYLCPANMDECRLRLIRNQPSLLEMVDKVFSHEIGHLAFYFYWGILRGYDGFDTIREKQANWISSISHNGVMDDLIEEITQGQPLKYRNPILLKHKSLPNYDGLVEGLYLRY